MSTERLLHTVRPVKVSTFVAADPATVFSYVRDTRNDAEWCPNVSDVRQTKGEGVQPGARFTFHQSVAAGGRTLDSDVDVEIIEVGDDHIHWEVEDRFQVRDIRLEVSPDGDGSRVQQTTTASFKMKPGLARWLYPRLARRTFKDQFQRLGELLADR